MDYTKLVGLDFETYSALPLPEVGLARYINDKTFLPTLAGIATHRGTKRIEFPALSTQALRAELVGKIVCAHNAGFERAVLKTMGIDIPVIDSAVVAAVAGADRHLAGAARQLLGKDKLDEDRSLLRLFALPQPGQIGEEFDHGLTVQHYDKWLQFGEYCERDAELSRQLVVEWHSELPLFYKEMSYAAITLAMNEAGWPVDVSSVEKMRDRYYANLNQIEEDFANTVDHTLNLFSHPQVKKWCADRGVHSPSFDKQHVEQLIERLTKRSKAAPLTPGQDEVLEMLLTKQQLGGSSLKKLETILNTVHEGRVYDQYVHAGAPQSLRTSGRSIQMQNLPKLAAKPRDMDELFSSANTWSNDELGENLRQVFWSSDPDGALIVGDFSSIESRGLAYMAGEAWKEDAYRGGEDVYQAQARKIFRLHDTTAVTKEQRTTGKVGELSCGYGAGPVAVKDFAAKMHVEMTETEAAQLVRDWRDANPKTVEFWYALGDAFYRAVEHSRMETVAAAHDITIKFVPWVTPQSLIDQASNAISMRMDVWKDGRKLMSRVFHGCYLRGGNIGYYKPSTLKGGKPWKNRYVDPKTKRQRYYELYGGKLAGILTQSLCREIFFESLSVVRNQLTMYDNVTIVGQFHDEIVLDWVPGDLSLDRAKRLLYMAMSSSVTHQALPMDAVVKHDHRYTK